jgi:hypothetical protein
MRKSAWFAKPFWFSGMRELSGRSYRLKNRTVETNTKKDKSQKRQDQ